MADPRLVPVDYDPFGPLPPPNDTELAIGGIAGARRYRDRVIGRDIDINQATYIAPTPNEGIWWGDTGIYGGVREQTPGLDEVLRGPREGFLPRGLVVTKDDLNRAYEGQRALEGIGTSRLIEEAPIARPQREGGPVGLDFWQPRAVGGIQQMGWGAGSPRLVPVDYDPFALPRMSPEEARAATGADRIIPQMRGTPEEAGRALWGMTGIPDIREGAQAFGRGEVLPGVGQMGVGLASLAALGAPVARAGVAVGREALGAVPGVLGDVSGASPSVARWFHGTRSKFDIFDTPEAYLTNDIDEALGYAKGVHLGGRSGKEPYVKQFQPKEGKVINVDDRLTEAMMNDDDLIDALEEAISAARKAGARYVEYWHPNSQSNGEHIVRVSLYPKEDLTPTAGSKP